MGIYQYILFGNLVFTGDYLLVSWVFICMFLCFGLVGQPFSDRAKDLLRGSAQRFPVKLYLGLRDET